MPRSLLIRSSQVRVGKRGAWNNFDQQKPYIQGIQTGELSDSIDADVLSTMISGVPSPWARAKLFGFAFRYSNRDPNIQTSGLIKFYTALLNEWKGLIACLALFPNRISLSRPIVLDSNDTRNLLAPASSLGRMLFEDRLLWTDTSKDKNEAKPFVQLIYYNGQLVGGTSPHSVVFSAASYSNLTDAQDLKWYRLGRFDDPLEYGSLDESQIRKLFLLVNNISKKLAKFEESINLNLQSRESLDLIGLKEFLKTWSEQIKSRGHGVSEEGTLDGELAFHGQFMDLFSLKTSYYRIGDRLTAIVPETGEYVEIDPQTLLLDSPVLPLMDVPGYDKNKEHAAVSLLAAHDRKNNEDMFFPLPLSSRGLGLFQRVARDMLSGSEDKQHRLSAFINEDGFRVVVELQLCVDGRMITPLKREYKIEPLEAGKAVIMWPDFVSQHWKAYYIYSELPATDLSVKVKPIFRSFDEGILFRGEKLLYGDTPEEMGAVGLRQLVGFDAKKADPKDHRYEVYRSSIPFAGLEVRMPIEGRESVVGYLLIKRPNDPSMGDRAIKDLSHTHNPNSWGSRDDRLAIVGFDFGSNNSCISYSPKNETNNVKPVHFTNRRVFLIGSRNLETKKSSFADHHELLFFQGEEISNGQLKSYVHQHNPISIVRGAENVEISGGVPAFEPNIQILEMEDSFMRTNAGIMKHNLKWSNDVESMNVKEGYLRSLWIKTCAELYAQGLMPHRLKWSYPSSLSKKGKREYEQLYIRTVEEATPIGLERGESKLEADRDPMTESEAVCNYALGPGGYSLQGDNLIMGIDVGGSTSDILLIGKVDSDTKLLKQSSIRLAANKLAQAARRSKDFREALIYFVTAPNSVVSVRGIEEMRKNPNTAPYFLNTVFDRLHTEEGYRALYKAIYQPKLASINKQAVQSFFVLPAYICGLLLYYAGELSSITVRKNGLTNVKEFNLCTFGKGGRLFDWLTHALSLQEATDYYNRCFKAGYGEGSESIELKLESKRTNSKAEVSFGLSATQERGMPNSVDLGDRDSSEIVGEDGIAYDGAEIKAEMPSMPEFMKNVTRKVLLPKEFIHLNRFLSIFFELVGPQDAGFIEDVGRLRARIPEVRNRLFNYISTDPEYQKAYSASRGQESEFDFRQSFFISEAMCYLDTVLMEECFRA